MILPTLLVILCGAMVMGVYNIEVPWLQISQQTLLGIILFGLGELAHTKNVKEMYSVGVACSIVPLMLFCTYLGRYYFDTTGTSVLIFMFLALSGIYVCLPFSNKIQFGGYQSFYVMSGKIQWLYLDGISYRSSLLAIFICK